MKTFCFLTTLLLIGVLFLSSSLAAEEIKNRSPDGRFALRITDDQKVELIEKASGSVMVDLGEAWHNPGQVSQILVWSGDSKRVAYGNRGYKEGEVSVYFWNGSSFEQVALPEELPSPISTCLRAVVQ